jgi:hypothetical protein
MIFRLTQNSSKRFGIGPLPAVPRDEHPWCDWSARVFTVDRAPHILLSNTMSLYSVVMPGRGITNEVAFIQQATSAIREFMIDDGFGLFHMRLVAPRADPVRFAKSLNRSVTGSMNELEAMAKLHLASGEVPPFEVGFKLNETPMTAIGTAEGGGYSTPRAAFKRLVG